MKLPLKGIIPPMVTPLLENKELDSIGLSNLIEHLIAGGVHGIFLLGTNGEGPSLSYRIRKQLVLEACEIIDGRVPVLVGVTDTSFEATIEMSNYAKEVGADVLVVAPPFYFPISEEEMNNYLTALAPLLPLPFLLYNIPSCTKLHLGVDSVKKAFELGAIGFKDSSGDIESLYEIIEAFKDKPDFSVIVGNELFLSDTIVRGAHGAVSGGANFSPRLFVELYNACLNEDHNRIQELSAKVSEIDKTIYNVDDSPTRSIKGIKSALAVMGICDDYMAQPLQKLDSEKRTSVKSHLMKFKVNSIS
ncbi:dihydrodipicolinate synthase family protein [Aurantibacter crassamenti]|uniref:dihydrodipicolinate synthase family protein n=1 Tax=Aurantibacter crassamenti TaxID=1837375 RepID=UPI0019399FB6|nr:dihydrodipicolinate synthase family protein [Aurantibacter crassamenti]MBM1105117.1 dihydrodipicolinate synthase family protein [Aurantibacter crassamenti]